MLLFGHAATRMQRKGKGDYIRRNLRMSHESRSEKTVRLGFFGYGPEENNPPARSLLLYLFDEDLIVV